MTLTAASPSARWTRVSRSSPGILRVRKVVHLPAESFARPEDIRLRDGRVLSTALRKQIAAEERPRTLLHEVAALPRVRQVRRVEPPQKVFAER